MERRKVAPPARADIATGPSSSTESQTLYSAGTEGRYTAQTNAALPTAEPSPPRRPFMGPAAA
ncbi:hypothetical protein ACN28S_31190 [Cystobacter fuscus]